MTTLPAGWKPRLSCPFCGSNFLFTEPDEYGSGGQWVSPIHVGCNDCKAEQVGDTEDEAVSRWNARSTPSASAQDDAKDVEAAARAIWAIRREHEDRCDMELEDMGAHHPVWEEARVAVAAITAKVGAPVAGDARALLDHPLLREVLGYIEDAGPADVWGAAQSWMALRDAASQQQEG